MIWRAESLGCALYAVVLTGLFTYGGLWRRAAPGTLRRTLFFILFWPLLKFFFDAGRLLWNNRQAVLAVFTGDGRDAASFGAGAGIDMLWPELRGIGMESGVLFIRLCLLMGTATALTLLTSPHGLGSALTWLIRPVAGKHAWKPALMLALMVQFLPIIHNTLETTRTACRLRGLPTSGFNYWKIAAPQVITLLSEATWEQATAVASRHLDVPEAWQPRTPLKGATLVYTIVLPAAVIMAGL